MTITYTTDSVNGVTWDSTAPLSEEPMVWTSEPFCFVCSRCTDHFAEHDSLVALGLASYSEDGSVDNTPLSRRYEGELIRGWYDEAIDLAIKQERRGAVSLIKPEGYALTRIPQYLDTRHLSER